MFYKESRHLLLNVKQGLAYVDIDLKLLCLVGHRFEAGDEVLNGKVKTELVRRRVSKRSTYSDWDGKYIISNSANMRKVLRHDYNIDDGLLYHVVSRSNRSLAEVEQKPFLTMK